MNILADVIELMTESPLHSKWYVSDIQRLIVPPISLGQYVYGYEEGRLVGFATFCFMDQSSLDSFLNGTRKVQAEDFCSGDIPVLMDVIAPFGHGAKVALEVRKILRGGGLSGRKIWYVRRYQDHRIVKASML